MTAWNTRIRCTRVNCDGSWEAVQVEELNTEFRVIYHVRCTECDLEGTWREMASRRFPARRR